MDLIDSDWITQLSLATQVLIAAILGGLIGLEREIANRPAGLRTHALLAAAAALFVGLAFALPDQFVDFSQTDMLRVDPIRVIEAIVTGTAFVGAGTIFRHRDGDAIEGLTTAASLLLVAGIGITVAMQKLLLALLVTALGWILLRVVAKVTRQSSTKQR